MATTSEWTIEEAKKLAARVLSSRDESIGWRDAGYKTALAAARVMVGDSADPDVAVEAAKIVAAEIEG